MNQFTPVSGAPSYVTPSTSAVSQALASRSFTSPNTTSAVPVPGVHPVVQASTHGTIALHHSRQLQSSQALSFSQSFQAGGAEMSSLPLQTTGGPLNIRVPPHMTNPNLAHFSASGQASFLRYIQHLTGNAVSYATRPEVINNQPFRQLAFTGPNGSKLNLLVDQNNVLHKAQLSSSVVNASGQTQLTTQMVHFDAIPAFPNEPSLTLDDIQWLDRNLPANVVSDFINEQLHKYDPANPNHRSNRHNPLISFTAKSGNPPAIWHIEVEFGWHNGRFAPERLGLQAAGQQKATIVHPWRMRTPVAPSSSTALTSSSASSTRTHSGTASSLRAPTTLTTKDGFLHRDAYRKVLPPEHANARVDAVIAMSDALGVVLPFDLVGNPVNGLTLPEVIHQLRQLGIQTQPQITLWPGSRSDAGPGGKGLVEYKLQKFLEDAKFDGAVVEYHWTDRSVQPQPAYASHFIGISRHGSGNQAYWRLTDSWTGQRLTFSIGEEQAMAGHLASLYRKAQPGEEKLTIRGLYRSEIANVSGLRAKSAQFLKNGKAQTGGTTVPSGPPSIPDSVVPDPGLVQLFGLEQPGAPKQLQQIARFFTYVATQPAPTPEMVQDGARYFRINSSNWRHVLGPYVDRTDAQHAQVMSDLLGYPLPPQAMAAHAPDRGQSMLDRINTVAMQYNRSANIDSIDASGHDASNLTNFVAGVKESRLLIEFSQHKDGQKQVIHIPMRRDAQGNWWANHPTGWQAAPGGLEAILGGALKRSDSQTPVRILRLGEPAQTNWTPQMHAQNLVDGYAQIFPALGIFDGMPGQHPSESNDAFIARVARTATAAGYSADTLVVTLNNLLKYARDHFGMQNPTFAQLHDAEHLTPGSGGLIEQFSLRVSNNSVSTFAQGKPRHLKEFHLNHLLNVLEDGSIKKKATGRPLAKDALDEKASKLSQFGREAYEQYKQIAINGDRLSQFATLLVRLEKQFQIEKQQKLHPSAAHYSKLTKTEFEQFCVRYLDQHCPNRPMEPVRGKKVSQIGQTARIQLDSLWDYFTDQEMTPSWTHARGKPGHFYSL